MIIDKHSLNYCFYSLVADVIATLDIFKNIKSEEIFVSIEYPKSFSYFGVKGFVRASMGQIPQNIKIQNHPEKRFVLQIHLRDFWYGYQHTNATSRLTTIIHELFHIDSIGQGFRLLPSKVSVAHGNNGRIYNYFIRIFAEQYLKNTRRKKLCEFLGYKTLFNLCQAHNDPPILSLRKMRNHSLIKINRIKMSDFDFSNSHSAFSYY